jgi:hypothetical protein
LDSSCGVDPARVFKNTVKLANKINKSNPNKDFDKCYDEAAMRLDNRCKPKPTVVV